jgi:parvulin-like peptidyl-prolyl isomerase
LAKKKIAKPARYVSKQQLSHREKQEKKQRLISIIGLFIIVTVVVVMGVGWFITSYQPMHKAAIRVNNATFNMDYYINMIAYRLRGNPPQYASYLTDLVAEDIVQNELIKENAAKLGYTVSDEEISKALKGQNLPVSRVSKDTMRTRLLNEKMAAEYFDSKVPTTADQRHLLAIFLEGEFQATTIRNRIQAGESFSDLAAQFSLQDESKQLKGDFGYHPLDIFINSYDVKIPADWAFANDAGALSLPLYDANISKNVSYWLIRVVGRDVDNEGDAHIQTILLGSLEDADKVRTRLLAGEDFATVAKEVSLISGAKENGGDLGPIEPGKMHAVFDAFAFDLKEPLNTISPPIRDIEQSTQGGYWLVKVQEKEANRTISATDREQLKQKAFGDWVAELMLDPANKIDDTYLDENRKALAAQEVQKRMTSQQAVK